MKVAIYARVSQAGQSVENQITALTEVGGRLGWSVGSAHKVRSAMSIEI